MTRQPQDKARRNAPPLFAAAMDGDWVRLDKLLAMGADIHERNEVKSTILHAAAQCGRAGLVRRLIAMGAEVDAVDERLGTPLQTAMEYDAWKVCHILLDAGANPNPPSDFRSLLMDALIDCDAELVRHLLIAGADIEFADDYGDRPLHYAAENDWNDGRDCLRMLLDSGAEPNVANKEGETPYTIACRYRNEAAAQLLREHGANPRFRSKVKKGRTQPGTAARDTGTLPRAFFCT